MRPSRGRIRASQSIIRRKPLFKVVRSGRGAISILRDTRLHSKKIPKLTGGFPIRRAFYEFDAHGAKKSRLFQRSVLNPYP